MAKNPLIAFFENPIQSVQDSAGYLQNLVKSGNATKSREKPKNRILSAPELAEKARSVGGLNLQQYDWWNSNPNKKEAWSILREGKNKEPDVLSDLAHNAGKGLADFFGSPVTPKKKYLDQIQSMPEVRGALLGARAGNSSGHVEAISGFDETPESFMSVARAEQRWYQEMGKPGGDEQLTREFNERAIYPIFGLVGKVGEGILDILDKAYYSPAALHELFMGSGDMKKALGKLVPEGYEQWGIESTREEGDKQTADAFAFSTLELSKMGISLKDALQGSTQGLRNNLKITDKSLDLLGIRGGEIDITAKNLAKNIQKNIVGLGEAGKSAELTGAIKWLKENPLTARIVAVSKKFRIDPGKVYEGFAQDLTRLALPAPKRTIVKTQMESIQQFLNNPVQYMKTHAGLSIQDVSGGKDFSGAFKVPKDLEPLAKEVQLYKSIDDFVQDFGSQNGFESFLKRKAREISGTTSKDQSGAFTQAYSNLLHYYFPLRKALAYDASLPMKLQALAGPKSRVNPMMVKKLTYFYHGVMGSSKEVTKLEPLLETSPQAGKTKVFNIAPIAEVPDNLTPLVQNIAKVKKGEDAVSILAYLPKELIGSEKALVLKYENAKEIIQKHGSLPNENTVLTIHQPDYIVQWFDERKNEGLNFIKKVDEDDYFIVGAKKENGFYTVTVLNPEPTGQNKATKYVKNLLSRGKVLYDSTGGAPHPSLATFPPEGTASQLGRAMLSGVGESPATSISQSTQKSIEPQEDMSFDTPEQDNEPPHLLTKDEYTLLAEKYRAARASMMPEFLRAHVRGNQYRLKTYTEYVQDYNAQFQPQQEDMNLSGVEASGEAKPLVSLDETFKKAQEETIPLQVKQEQLFDTRTDAEKKAIIEQGEQALREVLQSGDELKGVQRIEIDTSPEAVQRAALWAVAGNIKKKGFAAFTEDLQKELRRWINNRSAAKTSGYLRKREFEKYDKKGLEGILEFQAGTIDGYQEVKAFFDAAGRKATNAGIQMGYWKHYLPQLWRNSEQEVNEIVSRLTQKPSFSIHRTIESYQMGIKYGLTPRYTSISQLAGWYERTLEKALADRTLFKYLADEGFIQPEESAPIGWKTLGDGFPRFTTIVGEASAGQHTYTGRYAAPAELAKFINNYLDNPTGPLAKLANYTSKMKNIVLSSGVPFTAMNAHGFNILARSVIAAKNPVGQALTGLWYMVRPAEAEKYLLQMDKSELMIDAVQHGLKMNTEKEAVTSLKRGLAEAIKDINKDAEVVKAMRAKESMTKEELENAPMNMKLNLAEKIKLIPSWAGEIQNHLFENGLFEKMLPALKLKAYEEIYKDFLKNKVPEAKERAAEVTNNLFGGINYDLWGRSREMQNILRVFILAPDWAETNVRLGANAIRGFTPKNWFNPRFAPYRRMVRNMILGITTLDTLNYAMHGKHLWEQDPKHWWEIQIGQDENGDPIYMRPFGTAVDFLRIPLDVAVGLMRGDASGVFRVVSNRLSIPLGVFTHLAANTDYLGRPIYGKDRYGNDIPIEKQIANVLGELSQLVVPTYVKSGVDYATGKSSATQAALSGLELPFRFGNKDNEYYRAVDEVEKKDRDEREAFRPEYERIRKMKETDSAKADEEYFKLPPEKRDIYKKLKAADKAKDTKATDKDTYQIFVDIQKVKAEHGKEEADKIYSKLSPEQKESYQRLKKKFGGI